MAFDEELGRRIASQLEIGGIEFDEKRMFGGLGFMIEGKMCIGVVKDELMVRVLDEKYKAVLEMNHVRQMDFTGRPMKGFVYVGRTGFQTSSDLQKWLDLGIEFGKLGAVKSKSRKK